MKFESETIIDITAAAMIGLILSGLALHYFDVLFF
jgi:hypothetical protein